MNRVISLRKVTRKHQRELDRDTEKQQEQQQQQQQQRRLGIMKERKRMSRT